ncbi:hypothetical protein Q9Q99_15595 [Curtobacterium flaccumfaciens]|nr:hypothetical protein Q9Q99_15595 [Curtobacterium flaccumfaciens]
MLRARLDAVAPGAFRVSSAGTAAEPGAAMFPRSSDAVLRHGADPSGFAGTPLTARVLDGPALVLTLERQHRAAVLDIAPALLRRTFTLREFGTARPSAPRTGRCRRGVLGRLPQVGRTFPTRHRPHRAGGGRHRRPGPWGPRRPRPDVRAGRRGDRRRRRLCRTSDGRSWRCADCSCMSGSEAVGGAERVLDAMADEYPDADLFGLWNDAPGRYPGRRVIESALAPTPLRGRKALAVPFLPALWSHGLRDLGLYDWALVSSHLFAHQARVPGVDPERQFTYVHTPARYLWNPELDARGLVRRRTGRGSRAPCSGPPSGWGAPARRGQQSFRAAAHPSELGRRCGPDPPARRGRTTHRCRRLGAGARRP